MHTTEKDILKAQKWLRNLGSSIKLTGKMSIGMETALCTFQRKNLLPITGKLDDITWKALKKANPWWKQLFK